MKASHLKHVVITGVAYNTRDNTNLAEFNLSWHRL